MQCAAAMSSRTPLVRELEAAEGGKDPSPRCPEMTRDAPRWLQIEAKAAPSPRLLFPASKAGQTTGASFASRPSATSPSQRVAAEGSPAATLESPRLTSGGLAAASRETARASAMRGTAAPPAAARPRMAALLAASASRRVPTTKGRYAGRRMRRVWTRTSRRVPLQARTPTSASSAAPAVAAAGPGSPVR